MTAAKIVCIVIAAPVGLALCAALVLLFLPLGMEASVRLRGSCMMAALRIGAKRFKPAAFTSCVAYTRGSGLIYCGGKKFGRPVIAQSKKRRPEKAKRLARLLFRSLPGGVSVEALMAEGVVGGAERADRAVLAVGSLNGFFAMLRALQPGAGYLFNVRADAATSRVSLDITCIFTVRAGKLIINALKQLK